MKNFFLIISGILLSTSLFAQSQAKIVSDKITSIKTYEQSLSKGIDDKYIIEELSYDEAGRVIERKELNSKGDIKLWKKFKFDQSGNLIEEIVFDVEGKLEKREVSYYTNNLRTHKEYFDSKGRLYKKKTYAYEYRK